MLTPTEIWRRIWAEAAPEGKILAMKDGEIEERSIPEAWVEDYIHYHMDVQRGCLYSMLDIGPGDECSEYTLFGYGLGAMEQFTTPRGRPMRESAYSIAETNLRMPFHLPVPESFLVQEVGVVFSPSVPQELRNRFCENHGATLWIGDKVYQRFPLAGMFAISEDPTQDSLQGFLQIGTVPLLIESNYFFKMIVEASSTFVLTGRMRLWGLLRGLHARGVS